MRNIIIHRNSCFDDNRSVRFCDFYVAWENSVRIRVKESTLANYHYKAHKYILPYFGDFNVVAITCDDICCLEKKLKADNLSAKYLHDIFVLLKSILMFASQLYDIPNPMEHFHMPKNGKTEKEMLTKKDQRILEQYIATHHSLATLGIALAKSTGLRIGELCALQWADIDLNKQILTVRKTMLRIQTPEGERKTKRIITDPKSVSSSRCIPIPSCLIPFLQEFSRESEFYVLSGKKKPIEPRAMEKRFEVVLGKAGLPKVSFHALRHMFATNCIQLNFDMKTLSELLGHSSVGITMGTYVHSSLEQKAECMNRLTMAI